LQIETNLEKIAIAELELQNENSHFMDHIRTIDETTLDKFVIGLNQEISPQINCTECGNCCQTLMINITEPECERISEHLQQTTTDFKEAYVETSKEGTTMILNKMPCHFLKDKCCSIYEHRFTECREFPQLDNPNFKSRTFSTMMHYGRCPIIYNVMEQLKVVTGFKG
jgi:Fe-S-cluster containining protein